MIAGCLGVALALISLYLVGRSANAHGRVLVVLPEGAGALELAEVLGEAGVIEYPTLFALYVRVFRSGARPEAGPHLLTGTSSHRELVDLLARTRARPVVRVTLPEGFNLLQVAQRLDDRGICSAAGFTRVARDPARTRALGLPAPSAEGYLFPATYELRLNTSAAQVLGVLVAEAQRRFDRVLEGHTGSLARLRAEFGFGLHEIVVLASVVEKETQRADERGTVASVFLNRLRDSDFRPRQRLQSDPTAAYGCQLEPERATSCGGYRGKVTPAMLRDATNRYNTYAHAGLPPGPICNPSSAAVEAVLSAPPTDYLFFVADGRGGHVFTRTLEEHQAAIDSTK